MRWRIIRNMSTGACMDCGTRTRSGHRHRCVRCLKVHRAEMLKAHRIYNANRPKDQDGKNILGDCEVCGVPNAHAHHDDYSKPMEIRWLCKSHHYLHHHGLFRSTLRKRDKVVERAFIAANPEQSGQLLAAIKEIAKRPKSFANGRECMKLWAEYDNLFRQFKRQKAA